MNLRTKSRQAVCNTSFVAIKRGSPVRLSSSPLRRPKVDTLMQLESPKRLRSEPSSVIRLPALKEEGSIPLPALPTDVDSMNTNEDTVIMEGTVDVSNEVNNSVSINEDKSECAVESLSSISINHGLDATVGNELPSEKSDLRDISKEVQTDEEFRLQQLSTQMQDFVLLLSSQVVQNEQREQSEQSKKNEQNKQNKQNKHCEYLESMEDLESQLYSLQQLNISLSEESLSRHVASLFNSISSFFAWLSSASQVDVALFPFFFHCILFVQTVLLSNSSVKLYGILSNVLLEFSRNGSMTSWVRRCIDLLRVFSLIPCFPLFPLR